MCLYASVCVHMCVYTNVCMCVLVFVHVCVCVRARVCVCARACQASRKVGTEVGLPSTGRRGGVIRLTYRKGECA